MAAEDEGRTEEATQKKRDDQRKKEGKVLQSKEIVTTVSIFAAFVGLAIFSKLTFRLLMDAVEKWVEAVEKNIVIDVKYLMTLWLDVVVTSLLALGPLFIIVIAAPIIAVGYQTKWFFSFEHMKFDAGKFLKKFNPLNVFKNMFSMQTVFNLLKGIIELVVIIFILYQTLLGKVVIIKRLMQMDILTGIAFSASTIFSIAMTIAGIFVAISVADYLYQRYKHEEGLKMTRQEVKDEYKQTEGDPKIKQKIRQKQREIAMNQMMQGVPSADVVVRNPTHFAVALVYRKEMFAPQIVAKGKNEIARNIVRVAEEAGVYITENRELAQRLYAEVDIGKTVPQEYFGVLAEILSVVYAVDEDNKPVRTGAGQTAVV